MLLVDARPVDHPTARQRGIGRYVTGLLNGFVDIDAPVIALYGSDAEADVLADAVPGLSMRRWSPQVVRDHAVPGTWYLATQLMLHPITLDPIPHVITEARLPVAGVLYDVIPFRFPDRYLAEPNARRQAQLRAPLARTVDSLLAISDFAAITAADELRVPIERIGMIGAGVETAFRPPTDDPRGRSARVLPSTVGPYVVAVTGGDDRKNTEGLLRAWAHVETALGRSHHLVIANAHSPTVLRRWTACATDVGVLDRVVFTGALDDDEMVAVVQGAELAVMPSFEEGFGLPVLEAAACGVPAISSNLSSLPEVLAEPAACFDPHDSESIATAIVSALTDDVHREVLLAAGRRATERWTWPNTATATIDFIESSGPRWAQRVVTPARRVALAGAFSADLRGTEDDPLVDAIRRMGIEPTVFVDGAVTDEPTHATATRWPVRSLGRYVKPWDFDHVVVVLGEPSRHAATGEVARSTPCHLWVTDAAERSVEYGANLRALDIARSVIVSTTEAADRLRRIGASECPVVVLGVGSSPDAKAAALAEWLADVDGLEPSTVRHR